MSLKKINRRTLFCEDCKTYIRVEFWEKYPRRCPFCHGFKGYHILKKYKKLYKEVISK